MSKVGKSITRGLEQALAFAEGKAKKDTDFVHIPPEIDVKGIRGRLGLTQQEFAVRFRFNIKALRDWEHGRLAPDGSMRSYLRSIDRERAAVEKALRNA